MSAGIIPVLHLLMCFSSKKLKQYHENKESWQSAVIIAASRIFCFVVKATEVWIGVGYNS